MQTSMLLSAVQGDVLEQSSMLLLATHLACTQLVAELAT